MKIRMTKKQADHAVNIFVEHLSSLTEEERRKVFKEMIEEEKDPTDFQVIDET